MISESSIEDELWEWLALGDGERELVAVYREHVDASGSIEDAQDSYQGTFESEEDWAESFLDDTGILKEVPRASVATSTTKSMSETRATTAQASSGTRARFGSSISETRVRR